MTTKVKEANAARPNPAAAGCECQPCAALRKRYAGYPDEIQWIGRKLLIHGWPGHLDAIEKAYVRAHRPGAEAAAERSRERAALSGFGTQTGNRLSEEIYGEQTASEPEKALFDLEAIQTAPVLV